MPSKGPDLRKTMRREDLRMIDLNAFIDSLKLSWLKRLFRSQSIAGPN